MVPQEFALRLEKVADKYVNCSLSKDAGGYIRCNSPAYYAVHDKNTHAYLYRCVEHRAIVSLHPEIVEGDYTKTVPRHVALGTPTDPPPQ